MGWRSDEKYSIEFYWNVKRLYGATIWQNTVWNSVEEQFAEILSEIIWNIVAGWENAQGHSTSGLLEPCAERGTPLSSEVIGNHDEDDDGDEDGNEDGDDDDRDDDEGEDWRL